MARRPHGPMANGLDVGHEAIALALNRAERSGSALLNLSNARRILRTSVLMLVSMSMKTPLPHRRSTISSRVTSSPRRSTNRISELHRSAFDFHSTPLAPQLVSGADRARTRANLNGVRIRGRVNGLTSPCGHQVSILQRLAASENLHKQIRSDSMAVPRAVAQTVRVSGPHERGVVERHQRNAQVVGAEVLSWLKLLERPACAATRSRNRAVARAGH